MTEIEALKKAMAEAKKKETAEQALREKHEARVIEAEKELQEAMKKMRDLGAECNGERIRTHQGASGRERCPGETQSALQGIQEARKIAAGKAFPM